MSDQNYPSDEEIEAAVKIIEKLPRGFLPYQLFMAIASKVVTPTLELNILSEIDGVLSVLLTKRPDDDRYWPGQWHVPGTVIRSTDEENTLSSCFARILSDELMGQVKITDPQWVSTEFWEVERGREIDQLFYVELKSIEGDLPEGIQFFPVDALPTNLMRHHVDVIDKVVTAYLRQK